MLNTQPAAQTQYSILKYSMPGAIGGLASGGARLHAPFHVQAREGQEAGPRRHQVLQDSKYHPENYLSHHLSAISMAAGTRTPATSTTA